MSNSTVTWSGLDDWLEVLTRKPLTWIHAIVVDIADRLSSVDTARLLLVLDSGEKARSDAFRFQNDRQRFIVSRALLRLVAAGAGGIPPGTVDFAAPSGSGQPPRLSDVNRSSICLSLSRSGRFVACAIGFAGNIGIDVEAQRKIDGLAELTCFCLDEEEQKQLVRLPEIERDNGFLSYWTAKESALKAYGSGLRVSPKDCHVELDSTGRPIRVSINHLGARTCYQSREFKSYAGSTAIVAIANTGRRPLRLSYTPANALLEILAG